MNKQSTVTDTNAEAGKVKHKPNRATVIKTIEYWHLDDTELNKVLSDLDKGDNLTRAYTLVFTLGATPDYTNTETVVITEGTITYAEGGFLRIRVSFGVKLEVS